MSFGFRLLYPTASSQNHNVVVLNPSSCALILPSCVAAVICRVVFQSVSQPASQSTSRQFIPPKLHVPYPRVYQPEDSSFLPLQFISLPTRLRLLPHPPHCAFLSSFLPEIFMDRFKFNRPYLNCESAQVEETYPFRLHCYFC